MVCAHLYSIPDRLIDGIGGDPLDMAEYAAQMRLRSRLHSEVMEWTTTSVRPGGKVRLSEGLEQQTGLCWA